MIPRLVIGRLFLLLGWIQFAATAIAPLMIWSIPETRPPVLWWGLLISIALGIFYFVLGKAIREGRVWGRIVGVIYGALMLVAAPPASSVVGAFILWYLIREWDSTVPSSGIEKGIFIVSLLTSMLVAWATIFTVPKFADLFEGFGAELPFWTRIIMQHHEAVLILPMLVLVAWLIWPRREDKVLAAFGVGVGGGAIVAQSVTIGMYLPIFVLGAVVG